VDCDHQEIVVSDAGVSSTTFSTPIDVDVFAKGVVGTDSQERFFIAVLEILRRNTDHTEGEKVVVAAD